MNTKNNIIRSPTGGASHEYDISGLDKESPTEMKENHVMNINNNYNINNIYLNND
jgi:hypothetical protein